MGSISSNVDANARAAALVAQVAALAAQGTADNALEGSFYGDAYRQLLGSRSLGVTYTNSTGRAMFVHARVSTAVAYDRLVIACGGAVFVVSSTQAVSGQTCAVGAIIPNGGTYTLTTIGGGTLAEWCELGL